MSIENKRAKGAHYEDTAAEFLAGQGYTVLERNFQTRRGEIDLIARDGAYLVFVEVKFRSSPEHGYPEEAVDGRKQKTIRQAAVRYLYIRGLGEDTPCRFDVVSILGDEIRLIRDAF